MLRGHGTTESQSSLISTPVYPAHPMQTRYLILAALATALAILAASVIWFLRVAS
jgi:hypothetical protein